MKKYRVRFEVPKDANRWIEVTAHNKLDARVKAESRILKNHSRPIEICEVTELLDK